MPRTLLTIAIPTYNRPVDLEKILVTLESEKNKDFNILVSDDSTSDDTKKMMKKYQQKLKNLQYVKNKVNLGFSQNVYQLYKLCKTEYIWFFCDDDSIVKGSTEKIITALKRNKPTVAVLNYSWINAFGQKCIGGVNSDICYTDLDNFKNYTILQRLTFLSIVVVKKEEVNLDIPESKIKDNVFFQITLCLHLLSNNFNYCEIAVNALHRNVGYKYGEFFKFYLLDEIKAVLASPHIFSEKKYIQLKKRGLFTAFELYLSQKLGLFKYIGKPTSSTRKLILSYYGLYSVIIFLFPIMYLIIPGQFLKLLYFIGLRRIHGNRKAKDIYNSSINRAYKDDRKTGFTNYR